MKELIERVRKRIDEVGDCWEWNGSMQSNSITPQMHYKNRVLPVRRILAAEMGLKIEGMLVTCKCRNELCVNPDHLMVVTRQKLSLMVAKRRNYNINPVTLKKLSDSSRRYAKLTPELAAEIREAEGVHRDIAARYGVSQPTVSSIKRGATWRDYTNPFSQLFKGLK